MNYLIYVQAKEVPCLKVTFPIMSVCEKSISILKFGLNGVCLKNPSLLFYTLMALLSSFFSVSEVLRIYNFGCAVPFFSSKNATLGMLDRCCYSLIIRESTLLPTILMGYS